MSLYKSSQKYMVEQMQKFDEELQAELKQPKILQLFPGAQWMYMSHQNDLTLIKKRTIIAVIRAQIIFDKPRLEPSIYYTKPIKEEWWSSTGRTLSLYDDIHEAEAATLVAVKQAVEKGYINNKWIYKECKPN